MKKKLFKILSFLAFFSLLSCSNDNELNFKEASNESASIILQTLNNEKSYDVQAEAVNAYEKLISTFNSGKTRSLSTKYPDYYGGAYITEDGKLVVFVTGPTTKSQNNQSLISNIVGNVEIEFVPAAYSYNELNEIMDCIDNAARNQLSINQYMDFWCIKEIENKIIVDLNKNDEEVIAEFKKTISDSPAIEFRNSSGRIKTEVTLSPGQFITGEISGSSSVGYRVTRNNQQGVIMAGHATFKNDVFRVNGINVAKCEITMQQGSVDAAFCSTMGYGTAPDNYIYGTKNELSTETVQPGAGTRINKCGFATGMTDGYVQDIRATGNSESGELLTNLTTATYNSSGGDSGGVIYTFYSASGIRKTAGIHMGRQGNYAIYVKADEINAALNTKRF